VDGESNITECPLHQITTSFSPGVSVKSDHRRELFQILLANVARETKLTLTDMNL